MGRSTSISEGKNHQSAPVVGVIEPGYADYSAERRVLAPLGTEVRSLDWRGQRAVLLEQLRGVDVVLVRDTQLDAEAIAQINKNGGIVRYGVGVDTIDLDAAKRLGIRVANVPNYGAEIEVSDHAAALTLALVRRVVSRHGQVCDGLWGIGQKEPIYRIAGSTLGLLGFGKIARAYLERMRAFGVGEVLVCDPFLPDSVLGAFGVKRAGFDEICARAQIISLHAPATAENHHIVGERTLALMNKKTCLINTSRGGLVDVLALANALKSGKIFGAAVDVLDREPIANDCPLRGLKNAILSDHTGWYSEASVETLQEGAARAAYEILTTGTPTDWVNRW
jgi:D-3-phosphoglycerate dehydrogenase / 2-oxoglutarate reductase